MKEEQNLFSSEYEKDCEKDQLRNLRGPKNEMQLGQFTATGSLNNFNILIGFNAKSIAKLF